MQVRLAREEEFAWLATQLPPTAELTVGHVWVTELDGEIVGVLPLRLVWQAEPLLIFPSKKMKKMNKIARSRAALLMYLAAEEFVRDHKPNWLFAVTRSRAVKSWSQRLGWHRIYAGASFYIKYLPRR